MNDYVVYECEQCEGYVFAREEQDVSCCGDAAKPVDEDGAEYEPPSNETLFRQIFGMTETEMEICLCVMDEGEATVKDIADLIEVERSVASRYANHLVEVGFLKKSERNLKRGGRVHVYTHAAPEEVKRSLTVGFHRWAGEALDLIAEFERKKMESMADADAVDDLGVYWED